MTASQLSGRRPRRAATEDQMACAWIALRLARIGFRAENERTRLEVDRWAEAEIGAIAQSASAEYLAAPVRNPISTMSSGTSMTLDLVAIFDGREASAAERLATAEVQSRRQFRARCWSLSL